MKLPSTRALRAAGSTIVVLIALSGIVIATDPATGPATSATKTIVQTRVMTTERTIHIPAQSVSGPTEADDEGFEGDERD
ncbi:MAG: hypothetical protein WCO96_00130 [Actinomycetes bacterium]